MFVAEIDVAAKYSKAFTASFRSPLATFCLFLPTLIASFVANRCFVQGFDCCSFVFESNSACAKFQFTYHIGSLKTLFGSCNRVPIAFNAK